MLDVHFIFCYKRPKAHYKSVNKKPVLKDDLPFYKLGKPDIDNLCKFYMDAMNGIFYTDDSQVTSINAVKVYGSEDYIHIKMFYNKNYCK